MRTQLVITLVACAALNGACSPAVGSKEWCDSIIKGGLAEVSKMPADQQQAAAKCAKDALGGF